MSDVAVTPAQTHCNQCGAKLSGPYCQACGQPSRAVRRSLRETMLGHTGRLVHTLRLLVTRPGEFAREIDQARDRKSVRPATLLLNLMAFFFIVGSGPGGFNAESLLAHDERGTLQRMADEVAARRGLSQDVFRERVERGFRSAYSILIPTVSAFVYAFMMWIVEYRKRKPWLVHFAASVQYLCITFVVSAVMYGAGRLLGAEMLKISWFTFVALALLTVYFVVMLVRVYRDTWPWAVAKVLLIEAVGGTVDSVLAYAALGTAILLA